MVFADTSSWKRQRVKFRKAVFAFVGMLHLVQPVKHRTVIRRIEIIDFFNFIETPKSFYVFYV
jgi:hypothetical protein